MAPGVVVHAGGVGDEVRAGVPRLARRVRGRAAGVAVAGFLQDAERYAGKDVAIVLCGANASLDVLRRVLS